MRGGQLDPGIKVRVKGFGRPQDRTAPLNRMVDHRLRQMAVDLRNDLGSRMRSRHGQDLGMNLRDPIGAVLPGLRAKTTRHNDPTIFGQCFADRIETLAHRIINEAAGIDHDKIRISIVGCDLVPVRTQSGQDQFTVDQRFRTTQGNETHPRRIRHGSISARRCRVPRETETR